MKKLIPNLLMAGGAAAVGVVAVNLGAWQRNVIFAGIAAAALGYLWDRFLKG